MKLKEFKLIRDENEEPGPEEAWPMPNKKEIPIEFEMASSHDPADIIAAAQRSMVKAMLNIIIILEIKNSPETKAPGLTWEQLEYFIREFGKQKPKVVIQSRTI